MMQFTIASTTNHPKTNEQTNNKPANKYTNKIATSLVEHMTGLVYSHWSGAGIMGADDRQMMTVFTVQPSFHHRHKPSILPSSANVQSHLTSSFADDDNPSWYWVCRVQMVEWRLDCKNYRHLTVVGLHDTGPSFLLLQVAVDSRRLLVHKQISWSCPCSSPY